MEKEIENYYLLVFNEDYGDEHDVPALACFNQKQYDKWLKTKQSIYANLGNSGDGFLEDELNKYDDSEPTGKECEKEGWINVIKVDKSFYKTFKKSSLSDLSLCTIFDNY